MQQHLWMLMEVHCSSEDKLATGLMSGCMTAGSQVNKYLLLFYNGGKLL